MGMLTEASHFPRMLSKVDVMMFGRLGASRKTVLCLRPSLLFLPVPAL